MSIVTDMKILSSMRWLKLSEAVIYSRMSKKTLRKYILQGDIYAIKEGGCWIVDRKSIDTHYKRNKTEFLLALDEREKEIYEEDFD